VVENGRNEPIFVGNSPIPLPSERICRIIFYDRDSFSYSVEWGIMEHKKNPLISGDSVG